MFFFRDKFEAQLKKLTQPAEQKKPGRKRQYDREHIAEFVFEKMEHHGEFQNTDPEWSSQSDLEKAVLDMLSHEGKAPAESTVRELIAEPLKDWRASRGR